MFCSFDDCKKCKSKDILSDSYLLCETFTSANVIKVAVGTNTPRGGDTGHGGITVFEFRDLSGTDWEIRPQDDGFVIILRGDTEAETFASALRFAADHLDIQMQRKTENDCIDRVREFR